jgi:hypothetical protein
LEKYLKNSAYLLIFLLLFGCGKQNLKLTGNLSEAGFIKKSGNLNKILVEKGLQPENVMLIGKDGVAVYLSASSLEFIWLERERNQWFSIATGLPEVANIKNLAEICLFMPKSPYSIQIQENDFSYKMSPFQARKSEFEIVGRSSKNGHVAKKLLWQKPFTMSFQNNVSLKDFYFSADGDTIRIIKNEKNH